MAISSAALALDNDDSVARGVLFDVDGTLVDTNYLHALCWARALYETEGVVVPMTTIHRHLGMGSDKITQELIGHHSDVATEAHSKHYRAFWDDVRPFPGVRDLLAALQERNVEVVLASSAGADEFDMLQDAISARDIVAAATNSGDVEHSKPDPDIFAVALERGGHTLAHAVVVGDSVWDVQGARNAGLESIGLLSGGISRDELLRAGAVEVWDDPQQLFDNLDDSALGRLWNAE